MGNSGGTMATRAQPVSQAEMTRQTERLDQQYRIELLKELEGRVAMRFTMRDMTIITGWTQEYLFRLEKTGTIPRARRVGTRRIHQWTEAQARTILGFAKAQDERFGRFKSGA